MWLLHCHCTSIKVLNAMMPVFAGVYNAIPVYSESCSCKRPYSILPSIDIYKSLPLWQQKFAMRKYYSYKLTIPWFTIYAYFLCRSKDHVKSKYHLDLDIKCCILIHYRGPNSSMLLLNLSLFYDTSFPQNFY